MDIIDPRVLLFHVKVLAFQQTWEGSVTGEVPCASWSSPSSVVSLPGCGPSICGPRMELGPGQGSGKGQGWIANCKSREIHGNNYRRMDWKGKQTVPSKERSHRGLARGRNWGLGGDASGRAGGTGTPGGGDIPCGWHMGPEP